MAQAVATDSIQVVTFSLVNQSTGNKEDYAVPIEQVKEIRTIEEITKVPKAKSFVKGIMNLRGLIIPVIDVKDKLGFGSTQISKETKQRILVADVNNSLYGLLVDEVDQVMRIASKDIGPAPPGAFETYNYVKGIAKTQNELIVLLDVVPLIDDSVDPSDDLSGTNSDIPSDSDDTSVDSAPPAPPEPENTQVPEPAPEADDIPDELKAVFDEDTNGIEPTEITVEEIPAEATTATAANPDDFQSKVDEEAERMRVSALQA